MRLRPAILSAAFLLFSSPPLFADPVSGYWLTHKSKGMVQISQCGAGLCGQIIWLRQSTDRKGQPARDVRNRNPELRGRPVMGLTTFSGLAPIGPNQWAGPMYNPDDGRTYNGKVTLTAPGKLHIRGCRQRSGICGSRTWTRAQQRAAN